MTRQGDSRTARWHLPGTDTTTKKSKRGKRGERHQHANPVAVTTTAATEIHHTPMQPDPTPTHDAICTAHPRRHGRP
jgi:hypothetical protein